jgi:hypothetical protein
MTMMSYAQGKLEDLPHVGISLFSGIEPNTSMDAELVIPTYVTHRTSLEVLRL